MKRKLLSVVAIGALLAGGLSLLASCNSNNNPSGGDATSQKENVPYTVTCAKSDDYSVTGLKESYLEGETVTFTVSVTNSAKLLKNVKLGKSTTLTPNANGEYSFAMPAENVTIYVNLSDVVVPVLTASYTGLTRVGQTLAITSQIDNVNNDTFTVTAKSGASLVEINGHNVILKAAGAVVLEISATKDSYNLKAELSFRIYEDESALGANIAYDDFNAHSGNEDGAKLNKGTIIYWSGDGGDIHSFVYNKTTGKYTVDFTNSDWAFYGVQMFYEVPYVEAGDSYRFVWEVNSDAAGKITISGQQIDIVAGDNYIAVDVTKGSGALISIQLGTITDGVHACVPATKLVFSPFRMYDLDKAHVYHHVTFTNGNEVLKDIYVRDGKTVAAPAVNPDSTHIFEGFYDGETKFLSTAPVTADHNYQARMVEKTPENTKYVTLKRGSVELAKIEVLKGASLLIPEDFDAGFGRKIVGYYLDAAFTQPYNIDDPVNADFDLYLKTRIEYEATYSHNMIGGSPDTWFTYEDDGTVVTSLNGPSAADSWNIQCNFNKSVPIGVSGEHYTIRFVYSMNVEGGRYHIYDGNSYGANNLEVGNNLQGTLEYDGGVLKPSRYFTFELGSTSGSVVFKLHDISVTKA